MKPRAEALFSLLAPGETGRRAVEETAADWREARSGETTMIRRLAADAQGVASVLHVFATLTRVQIVGGAVWRPLGFAAIVAAVLGFAMCVPALMRYSTLELVDSLVPITLMALASGLVVWFPVAGAVGLGLRRDEAAPILGQMLVAVVLLVMMTGWVVPAANQEFRVGIWTSFYPQQASGPPPLGLAAQTLPELLSSRPENVSLALSELNRRLAIVVAGPIFLFLGAAVRRRVLDRHSWRLAQIAGGCAALAAVATGMALSSFLPVLVRIPGSDLWLIVAAAGLLAIIAATARRVDPAPANPEPGT